MKFDEQTLKIYNIKNIVIKFLVIAVVGILLRHVPTHLGRPKMELLGVQVPHRYGRLDLIRGPVRIGWFR